MPKSKEQHLRYRIIDSLLRKGLPVKTTQMQRAIEETLGEPVDPRTIQKDIQDMKEDTRLGYYAPIEYDTRRKAHRYTDKNYSIQQVALQDHEINALKFYASALQMYSECGLFKDFSNAIQKVINGISIKHTLKKATNPDLIIQTDTIVNIPGSDLLEPLVQAIDEKCNICFQYQKFNGNGKKEERTISPYLLKEYRNRWYLLGMTIKEKKIRTFGLDRMSKLHLSGGIFQNKESFDPEKYFKHCFGITAPDTAVENIVLKFSRQQIPYIKSLPIHPTQVIIKETRNELVISIEVIPSYELYEYILGKMPDVKIISPAFISNHIKKILKEGLRKNR
jgi:predicted DNA-binding transcriptional regulator YafY